MCLHEETWMWVGSESMLQSLPLAYIVAALSLVEN